MENTEYLRENVRYPHQSSTELLKGLDTVNAITDDLVKKLTHITSITSSL